MNLIHHAALPKEQTGYGRRLREHPANRIVCVTHRGFIEYLVLEDQIFRNCEAGYFKFSGNVEAEIQRCGKGENTPEL